MAQQNTDCPDSSDDGKLTPEQRNFAKVLGRALAKKWREQCEERQATQKPPPPLYDPKG